MATLRIAEIFHSIQGEGIWTGVPSTFIRVSGCNLRCVWCDTPYASWNPEGPVMAIEEILAQTVDIDHVVVTGGEPLLFEATVELCRGLKELGKVITIETAGTVYRDLDCDLMSISPKLANSDPPPTPGPAKSHPRLRADFAAFEKLTARYACQLKFVVNPELPVDPQLAEIDDVLLHGKGVHPVLLMPEGIDAETLHRREKLLVSICMQRGWRLSSRKHIDWFGNKRGT